MSAQTQRFYTEVEYWQIEEDSALKHEFQAGRVIEMAQSSVCHVDIMGNALHQQLRGRSCCARISQQRVKAGEIQTYPNVVVACRPLQYDPNNANTLIDATVIVEVLSDSTQRNDRNAKFDAYKELPSLRHYLLIEQTPYHVEHYFLDENETWRSENFTRSEDVVQLRAIQCQLSLSDIYEDIE